MPEPSSRGRRAAWVLVIIMTGLVVLALLGVVVGFIRQGQIFMAAKARKAEQPVPSPTPLQTAVRIQLEPGARILSTSTEAGRMVLHVQTRTGTEVDIIDLKTGQLVSQVKTAP